MHQQNTVNINPHQMYGHFCPLCLCSLHTVNLTPDSFIHLNCDWSERFLVSGRAIALEIYALCPNWVMTGNGSFRLWSVLWQLSLAQLYGYSEKMEYENWHQINQNELWRHFSLFKCFTVMAFGFWRALESPWQI